MFMFISNSSALLDILVITIYHLRDERTPIYSFSLYPKTRYQDPVLHQPLVFYDFQWSSTIMQNKKNRKDDVFKSELLYNEYEVIPNQGRQIWSIIELDCQQMRQNWGFFKIKISFLFILTHVIF